jgi:hypothetical protein
MRVHSGAHKGCAWRANRTPVIPPAAMESLMFATLSWYIGTNIMRKTSVLVPKSKSEGLEVERIQTGVRIERRILKVLKALAEYQDMTLGDLLEGVVLHAFDGKTPFSAQTLRKISELKNIYELDLDARSSHRLREQG